MGNQLSTEKRAQIVSCLVEGMSIRATVRVTGAAKNTVTKLLADLGQACSEYLDGIVQGLDCETIEIDEIWAYCYSKQKNVPEEHQGTFGYGDVWTFVALDADTKLVPCYMVGERTAWDATVFIADLRNRLSRKGRLQITTDGHRIYRTTIPEAFGGDVDFAQLKKIYGNDPAPSDTRYSPAICLGTEARVRSGDPDPRRISTSYVERQNLSMRMGMRRFTRLTNAFSKKIENLTAAVSLHFAHYNLCRVHQTLKTTPAVEAGIEDHVWSVEELVGVLESN